MQVSRLNAIATIGIHVGQLIKSGVWCMVHREEATQQSVEQWANDDFVVRIYYKYI